MPFQALFHLYTTVYVEITINNSEQVEQYDTFPYALYVLINSTPVMELSEETKGISTRTNG